MHVYYSILEIEVKFGNELVIPSYTLLCIQSIIRVGIEIKLC